MQSISKDTFGPLIAYLVPGVTVLVGIGQLSSALRSWFAITPDVPTIGGFLYLTLLSIATGMTVSAVRWAVVDSLHRCTGLSSPSLDFSRLGTNVTAYWLLIEIHYQHYQFYANMFVATAVAYSCYRVQIPKMTIIWPDVAFVTLEAAFFATSRDTLKKYFTRSEQLLGERPRQGKTAEQSTSACEVLSPGTPRIEAGPGREPDTPSAIG